MNERETLLALMSLPTGYDVGLFGTLCLRTTDQGVYCVSRDEKDAWNCWERTFATPAEAVDFFLEARHKLKVGNEYER